MKCKFCNNWTCMSRTTDGNRQCVYEEPGEKMQVLQILDNIDWQSFRAEAAKDILCAMLTDQRISETKPYKDLVRMSLECTDELIKQLKEKEEK